MEKLNINGFTILYEKKFTDIINVRVIVGAGSTVEKKAEYGVAHFLEHMFFKGTSKHNYKEINRITSELGDTNAYTGREETVYYINTLAKNFERSVDILTETFFDPSFIEEEFDKEKGVITEEYQTRIDDPFMYFYGTAFEGFWGTSKFHEVVGNRNTIKNMKINNIIDFRNNNYKIDNIVFSVVGNIELEEVIRVFSKLLSNAPSIYYDKLDSSKIDYTVANYDEFSFGHKSKQGIIGFINEAFSAEDSFNNGCIDRVLKNGLGSGVHSLLFDRIREELGLCYCVGVELDSYKDIGDMLIYCLLDEKNINFAKNEILKIIDGIKQNGFDKELLEISKTSVLFNLTSNTETSEDYAGQIFDYYFSNGCKIFNFDQIKNNINTVTNDDIIKCANDIFNKEPKFVKMTMEK